MSKTYSTDPYWVHLLRFGEVRHDHSLGYCSIRNPSDRSKTSYSKHYTLCPRRKIIEFLCDGKNYDSNTCLSFLFTSRIEEEATSGCGEMHQYSLYDNSIPCSFCESELALCYYTIPKQYPGLNRVYSNPPRWWRKHTEHAVARGEKRRVLGAAKKYYNSSQDNNEEDNGDIFEMPIKFSKGWWG